MRARERYLIKKDSCYHFRMMVPCELRKKLGQEIKRSLGTGNLTKATEMCFFLKYRCNDLFMKVRNNMFNKRQIKDYINRFMNLTLWGNEAIYETYARRNSEDDKEQLANTYTNIMNLLKSKLAANDLALAQPIFQFIRLTGKIKIDPNSVEGTEVSREFIISLIEAYRVMTERLQGNYTTDSMRRIMIKGISMIHCW